MDEEEEGARRGGRGKKERKRKEGEGEVEHPHSRVPRSALLEWFHILLITYKNRKAMNDLNWKEYMTYRFRSP
jgi:hypothetical protein